MALTGTEEIRDGKVWDTSTGSLSTVTGTVVQVVNGWPLDADGRVVTVSYP